MSSDLLVFFGRWFLVICGFAAALALSVALIAVAAAVRELLFDNLRRIYSLFVIRYWLKRLEEGGMRVFEKAEQEDDAKRAAAAMAPHQEKAE